MGLSENRGSKQKGATRGKFTREVQQNRISRIKIERYLEEWSYFGSVLALFKSVLGFDGSVSSPTCDYVTITSYNYTQVQLVDQQFQYEVLSKYIDYLPYYYRVSSCPRILKIDIKGFCPTSMGRVWIVRGQGACGGVRYFQGAQIRIMAQRGM